MLYIIIGLVVFVLLVIIGIFKEKEDQKKQKDADKQRIIDKIRKDVKENKIKFITTRDLVLEYGI